MPTDDLFDHARAGINRGDRVAGTALAQQVLVIDEVNAEAEVPTQAPWLVRQRALKASESANVGLRVREGDRHKMEQKFRRAPSALTRWSMQRPLR
jgi:hypothetical protein